MLENKNQELINAIKEGKLYDYISNNYTKFTDYELSTIIKEQDYIIYQLKKRDFVDKEDIEELEDEMIEVLADRLQ